jgi:pimeloyl-ACP methyl ester carboxylesterase
MNAAIGSAADRAAAAAAIAAFEARGRCFDVEVDGHRVTWWQFGTGPPLLLLHGGHGCWLHWMRNVDALAASHAVWLPDLPGYHDSDPLPPDLPRGEAFAALVERLAASWRRLGAGAALDLAGFSFGGLVAGAWAAGDPSVGRLMLLGSSGHGTRRRPVAELRSWKSMRDEAQQRGALAHNLRAHMLHAADAADALAQEIHERGCLKARFHSAGISRSDLLQQLLKKIDRPVLFVWGEHDVTAEPRSVAELLVDGRREREARVIPAAGHWVQYEKARAVDALLLHWLARRR